MLTLQFAEPGDRPPDAPANSNAWRDRNGGVVARGFREAGACWMEWPSLATYRFAAGDPFITAYPMPGAPVAFIREVCRRSVLPLAMHVLGWEALHASAIVDRAGIVLFCAVSETGKSTIAFALRERGFPQWADDGVVFQVEDAAFAVPLPFEPRLGPEARAIFGARSDGPGRGTERTREQHYTGPLPVSAVCLLERVHGDRRAPPRIARLTATDAFRAMLVHALEFDPSDHNRRAHMMRTYLGLVATVPVFEVHFVPDRSRIGALCHAIVSGLELEIPMAPLECAVR